MATTMETATATWQIDPVHSQIEFRVRHMMVTNVRGGFSRFGVTLDYDETDLASSSVRAEIETASVQTGNEQRDAHLRSADFFDAENHPTITFESRRVVSVDATRFRIVGDLTIRGVTKELELDAEVLGQTPDPWGKERLGFTARGRIDRRQFGLEWNQVLEAGGFAVGTDVNLEFELQFVR